MPPRTSRVPRATPPVLSRIIRHRSPAILSGAPLHRVWLIHGKLVREEPFTAESLAAELEVATCTVKRQIDMMRDRLGLPIEWDASAHTYVYTRACDTLPLLRVDPAEALAFALAGRVLGHVQGTPLGHLLDKVLHKIAPVLGGAVSMTIDSIDDILSRPGPEVDASELAHFLPVLESILHRSKLEIAYAKAGSAAPESRLVHPLHLAELEHRWVLIAHDPARRGVRHFLLSRIHSVHATHTAFEPPRGFDARAYLRGCLGRFAGEREIEVRIALDAHAAAYAREQRWHPSQVLAEASDGGVVLTLRVNHLADVTTAVLKWGKHAEALAPSELRDQVRESVLLMHAKYSL